MAAHQAPPSLGFSRQETGVGCHFLLQCIKVKSESEVVQSCLTLSDPMDFSLPGFSIHGIFQTRVLEWGAIAFSVRYCRTRILVRRELQTWLCLLLSLMGKQGQLHFYSFGVKRARFFLNYGNCFEFLFFPIVSWVFCFVFHFFLLHWSVWVFSHVISWEGPYPFVCLQQASRPELRPTD